MRQLTMTAVLVFSLAAGAAEATEWKTKTAEVSYTLTHKLHEVEGTSKKVEVLAVSDASGIKVMARAPVVVTWLP